MVGSPTGARDEFLDTAPHHPQTERPLVRPHIRGSEGGRDTASTASKELGTVTVEYPVEEPAIDGDVTYIGLDIGETALITALKHLRLTRSCVAEVERSISEKRCTRP
jgi:hypothetical protein